MPVTFDFDKPRSRTTLETVSTIAHACRFTFGADNVSYRSMAVQPIDPAAIARFAGALECDDWQERLPQLDLVQESTFQDESLSSVRTAVSGVRYLIHRPP